MKKILFLSLGVALLLSSCEKDSLGVSTVTTYPTIELNGDQAMTVAVGAAYTDAGCVAMEGPEDITARVVTTGSVNTATAGVYTITYTVANKDGFTATNRRYVGVIDAAAAAMDISGVYKRTAGLQGLATVTKTSYPGLYINNNPGGITIAPDFSNQINLYMFQWTATKVGAPSQTTVAGEFACVSGTYTAGSPASYKWTCINAGYGTAARTFIKQ